MCAQLEGVQGWMRAILWYASHSKARTGQMANRASRPVAEALKHLVVVEPSEGVVAWRL